MPKKSRPAISDNMQIRVALIGLVGTILAVIMSIWGLSPELTHLVRIPTATFTSTPRPSVTPTQIATYTPQPTYTPYLSITPTKRSEDSVDPFFIILTVRVVDQNEKPIPNARVRLTTQIEQSLFEITDDNGFANFTFRRTAKFDIVVRASGYKNYFQSVDVEFDSQVIIIKMSR